jgi:hypothetical protein
MRVHTEMAFDPGGTTGYCIKREATLLGWDQLGPGKHHAALWALLEKEKPDVIIYELFVYQRRELTHGVSLNLDAKEYIGILTLWSELNGAALVGQNVGHVKAFCSDAKLEVLGFDLPHKWRHSKDSIRHYIYYQVHVKKNRALIDQLRGQV